MLDGLDGERIAWCASLAQSYETKYFGLMTDRKGFKRRRWILLVIGKKKFGYDSQPPMFPVILQY